MPRRPRITVPGVSLHLIQRGNNRQACFYSDEDYLLYLDRLEQYARLSGGTVHSYVLMMMTNYIHLLLTPVQTAQAIS